jgi:putative ABC transport system ATP-binding protein
MNAQDDGGKIMKSFSIILPPSSCKKFSDDSLYFLVGKSLLRDDLEKMMKQNVIDDVIATEGVEKIYSDNGVPVHAVRGIDLSIASGEFTAIVGPSGSGKTTFLNIISGLDKPTAGKVWLKSKLLSGMSGSELSDFRRDHIGFIFQAYNLIPVLTVEENVEYIMLLQGVPKHERHDRVAKILQEVGLEGMGNRFPPQLSGGQQQRVAIARAMVSQPSLILADEPTANLDSSTGAGLLDMMRELNEKTGMTFVFSTHDEMIMKRARRVITIKDGKIASDEVREV